MTDQLMAGSSPGSAFTLSETGWFNSIIFEEYLKTHFMKFAPHGHEPILILYDGHSSHISAPLIDWARKKNIILLVLPPHSSHLTQPLDVGCLGALKKVYYDQCEQFMHKNVGQVVTMYSVCALACKAFLKTMTHINITSAFQDN